ncbi:BspA family leucine-rich repeat surface protein [Flagellimonas algicola]|uniref:BspA family leucine-rich repeat surface protein n=1 Tax=Flagellimonas algicola TaxID=2583815 RepID=A0ABY2WKD8_9FLAO|nr:BspA family leucine-rich repeat surface protein [Allomuricauda algicola]TMU54997.1 BspA family leucine-rich repeat surface protein [Allomuricauda algicola]
MKLKTLFTIMVLGMIFLSSCEKDKVQENRPPQITVLEYDAQEDSSPVDIITIIQASDADADALSFAIVTNDNDLFVISDRGELRVANGQSLDYATATSHEIVISVFDGTETTTATITINVISVNQAPEIADQAFEVYEDFSGTDAIGALDFENPDGDDLTFEITVNDNDMFVVNNNGELFLGDGAGLDYETQTTHEITVEVSDGTAIDQGVITIEVQNVVDAPYRLEESSFIFTLETTEANEPVSLGIAEGGDYHFILDWGDGTIDEVTGDQALPQHNYAVPDTYTISINTEGLDNGAFSRILWQNNPNATKVKSIEQWGTVQWEDFANAFRGCSNMQYNATDAPDLFNVTDLTGMFSETNSFNGNLNTWDVSKIEKMRGMFAEAISFNGDISSWDVRNVWDFGSMFYKASSFNGNINDWQLEGASNISWMFREATSFNSDISGWTLGEATSTSHMFYNAADFDQDLGGWDISSVENMTGMLDHTNLSPENFENTLIGWAGLGAALQSNVTLGAFNLELCLDVDESLDAAVDFLVNTKQWDINGDSCNQ